MLRFLPIISHMEDFNIENILKYFLVQRVASIMFISFSIYGIINQVKNFELVVTISLFLKLGVAPFHTWFLNIVKNTSLYIIFMLSTIQKIIPLTILGRINIWRIFIFIIIILNFLTVFIGGVYILRFNKILGISRINNLIWLIIGGLTRVYRAYLFLIIYMVLLGGVVIAFNRFFKAVFYRISYKGFVNNMIELFVLISIGGLPPFLGFLNKIFILKQSLLDTSIIIIIILVFRALFILYYYIRFRFLASRIYSNTTFHPNSYKLSIFKLRYIFTILFFWGGVCWAI